MFLYETVLKQPDKVAELPRMKRPEQLPVLLSREEVGRILKVMVNLKRRPSTPCDILLRPIC